MASITADHPGGLPADCAMPARTAPTRIVSWTA